MLLEKSHQKKSIRKKVARILHGPRCVLAADHTLRKIHEYGIIALAGMVHCQHQVAFFGISSD